MLKVLSYITAICILCGLSACEAPSREFHHRSQQFGPQMDITLHDVKPQTAEVAFATLDENFAYLHKAWSPRIPGSLSRTNQLIKTGRPFSVGPSVMPLIEQAMALSEKTDGLFNPATGDLINLWQFHKYPETEIAPPSAAAIQQLLDNNPQMSDLKFNGIKMHSNNPAITLNMDAFARGYAIDLQIQQLEDMQIENAMIKTTGGIKAIGKQGEHPWEIAIQHPRLDTWLAKIELQDEESVFTSGDYQRFYVHNNTRYHAILDPRTGYPAMNAQSVTVLHTDSGYADAAATALFIAGPQRWLKIAGQLGINTAMLIDNKGTIYLSPEMKKRLVFNPQIETTIIVTATL